MVIALAFAHSWLMSLVRKMSRGPRQRADAAPVAQPGRRLSAAPTKQQSQRLDRADADPRYALTIRYTVDPASIPSFDPYRTMISSAMTLTQCIVVGIWLDQNYTNGVFCESVPADLPAADADETTDDPGIHRDHGSLPGGW